MGSDNNSLLHALCDEDLFTAFTAGNDAAYTVIYSRYSSRVLSYIYSILGGENRAAEDIFQESFLRLFRERGHYNDRTHREHSHQEPIKNIGGWLFRVARNLALNHIRSTRYLTDLPPAHDEALYVTVEEAHASIFADPLDEQALMEAVNAVVETLPAALREVFILREVNGMSYEETAEIIGCTAEAARMRLSRARSAIRSALQPLFAEYER
jgi:RNA polymerase sigma-70 factor (ECF subfamily)